MDNYKKIIRETVDPFILEKDKWRLEYSEQDVIKCMKKLEDEIYKNICSCCHKDFSGQIFCLDCFEKLRTDFLLKIKQGLGELEKGYEKSKERSRNANSDIGKGMWMGAAEACKNFIIAIKKEFGL